MIPFYVKYFNIPQDKRVKILNYINPILQNKHSDKKTLERLIGNLQNSSLIIFPGKAFVRRLEAVLHLPKWEYFHKIPISICVGGFMLVEKNIIE